MALIRWITQRNIYDGTSDSSNFSVTPSSANIVFVYIGIWPESTVVSVTVGGVAAVQGERVPFGSGAARLFWAYGSFSSSTVSISCNANSWFWWAAEEHSGVLLQSPVQQVLGTSTTSPTHCSVTSGTLTGSNGSLLVGMCANSIDVATSEFVQPPDCTMSVLNRQDYSDSYSACAFYRYLTGTTSAQTLTMGGAGNRNFGRMNVSVFDLAAPSVSGNALFFSHNF